MASYLIDEQLVRQRCAHMEREGANERLARRLSSVAAEAVAARVSRTRSRLAHLRPALRTP